MEEFNELIRKVLSISEKQLSNVHLLLGSFAVQTDDFQILNCFLYVECGDEAKIHALFKARAAGNDVRYGKLSNFSQQDQKTENYNFSGYIASDHCKSIISNANIFWVTTAGGAEYLQAVDICRDHDLEHAKNYSFHF